MKPQHITNGPQPFLKMTNRLRDLRLDKKMTQVTLADELKMPRGSYSLLESGVTLPNKRVLDNLIHVFRCTKSDLYSLTYLNIIELESDE